MKPGKLLGEKCRSTNVKLPVAHRTRYCIGCNSSLDLLTSSESDFGSESLFNNPPSDGIKSGRLEGFLKSPGISNCAWVCIRWICRFHVISRVTSQRMASKQSPTRRKLVVVSLFVLFCCKQVSSQQTSHADLATPTPRAQLRVIDDHLAELADIGQVLNRFSQQLLRMKRRDQGTQQQQDDSNGGAATVDVDVDVDAGVGAAAAAEIVDSPVPHSPRLVCDFVCVVHACKHRRRAATDTTNCSHNARCSCASLQHSCHKLSTCTA